MAAATLAEIREGLRVRLATIPNVQTSAYMLDQPVAPSFQVMGPEEITYDVTMQRGLDLFRITIHGYQGSPTDIGSQTALDEWLNSTGASSVKYAINADHTLGGLVQSARVASSTGYRPYDLPNLGRVLGAEWVVEVFNRGA